MPTQCDTIDLAQHGRRQVRACFDGGRMSSDGGALLLRAVDRRLDLTRRLAACFTEPLRQDLWVRSLILVRRCPSLSGA